MARNVVETSMMRGGLVLLLALAACSQSRTAELVDKSKSFYGRNGWVENGQPVPRYSASRPATLDQQVAYKYKERDESYGVDAAVDRVDAQPLAAPAPKMAAAAPPALVAATQAKPFSIPTTPKPQEKPAPAVAPLVQNPMVATVAEKAPASADSGMFRWPVEGKIVSRFGPKTDGFSNDGINIAANAGDPIWAAADGRVAYVGKELEGYGNLLIIRHKEGWMSSYAHAKEFLLKQDDIVAQGDLLGYVGSTGSVRTPQLHFSVRAGKTPVDPESVLEKSVASVSR